LAWILVKVKEVIDSIKLFSQTDNVLTTATHAGTIVYLLYTLPGESYA